MLNTQFGSRHRERPSVPAIGSTPKGGPCNPPVIVAAAAKHPPHPIYGNVPMGCDGFTLERQPVRMLAFWHEKAEELIWADPAADNVDELVRIQLEIFKVAMACKPTGASDVAKKLEILLRQQGYGRVENPDRVQIEDIALLSEQLREATEPLRPTKSVPAFQRGRKLTRAGLLYRYHAFLIGELETLSWNLYGCRDYAMAMRPVDDEVNKRTRNRDDKRASRSIFFDEHALPARARSVLKSLKIDTETSDLHRSPRRREGAR